MFIDDIKSGKIKDLKGALLAYANYVFPDGLKEYTVDIYYINKLKEAKMAYESFLRNPPTLEMAEEAYKDKVKNVIKQKELSKNISNRTINENNNLNAIKEKVSNWEIPSDKFTNFKNGLLKKIDGTLNYESEKDFSDSIPNKEYFIKEYMDGENLKEDLYYYQRRYDAEKERCDGINAWIKEFKEYIENE